MLKPPPLEGRGLKHVRNMVTYIKDYYGESWMCINNGTSFKRCSDKFTLKDLDTYNHNIHSVKARKMLKININKDRLSKISFNNT